MIRIDMIIEDFLPDFEPGRPSAFIIYKHSRGKSGEMIYYNHAAVHILAHQAAAHQKMVNFSAHLSQHCSTWRTMLDKSIRMAERNGEKIDGFFLDLIKSGTRRYRVKGFPLYNEKTSAGGQRSSCIMFTLERIHRDSINLQKIFRESKLNRREQDIIHLILADKSNKEIADAIGLSVNTVKGYLKLLMRKIGVSSKAGIVSWLLKPPPPGR